MGQAHTARDPFHGSGLRLLCAGWLAFLACAACVPADACAGLPASQPVLQGHWR